MELPRLIETLARPAAYPYQVGEVEVRQTHISVAFLAGPFVYKVKKPVAPGFLDFTTLDKRLLYCREEVRLNRRLAPDVYLGVVPITATPRGLQFEGQGVALEWAVKMHRLPDEATFLERVRRSDVDVRLVEEVARRIAAFHRAAETNDRISSFGRAAVVARTILDVFDRAAPRIEGIVAREVFARVKGLAEESLKRLGPLIDSRAARGVPRDCHGDLHLDHIYCFPDRPPPGDLVAIDCIEFNERFRFIDPVADMAFAVMDFAFHGRRDLARTFADAYFCATEDDEGRTLLPLYTAYRAAVRGMVDGMLVHEAEVLEAERAAAHARSRAHWLLALAELESPGRRPCLLLVAGLPGTGKSTLANALSRRAGFEVIRSDVIRKELAGLPADEPSPPEVRESLYSKGSTDRTYGECLRRAESLLAGGLRVLVDATLREEKQRRTFLNMAVSCGVPSAMLLCQADPTTIRNRLNSRRGDASDADWNVYLRTAASWEDVGEGVARALHPVSTDGTLEQSLGRACKVLCELGLADVAQPEDRCGR